MVMDQRRPETVEGRTDRAVRAPCRGDRASWTAWGRWAGDHRRGQPLVRSRSFGVRTRISSSPISAPSRPRSPIGVSVTRSSCEHAVVIGHLDRLRHEGQGGRPHTRSPARAEIRARPRPVTSAALRLLTVRLRILAGDRRARGGGGSAEPGDRPRARGGGPCRAGPAVLRGRLRARGAVAGQCRQPRPCRYPRAEDAQVRSPCRPLR